MNDKAKLHKENIQDEFSLSNKRRNIIFGVLLLGCIVCSFLQTALNTVLPVIMKEFNITASVGQWLTSAYSLAMGIMIPATPFLMKRFPTKKLFIISMGVFVTGLFLSATSHSFSMLMAGRILQAMSCGILLSLVQVVVLTIYPVNKRGTMMGIYGLAVGAVPVIAPSLAGLLSDSLGWNVIFWLAMGVALLDLVVSLFALKNITKIEKQYFDVVSMFFCSIGFCGILLGVGNFGKYSFVSQYVILPLLIGMISLVAFTWKQFHTKSPFLELRVFQNKEFRLSVIGSMLLYAVMMAGSMLIPIYVQTIRGNTATFSGLLMLPGSLVMAIASPFAGKIYDRIGIRKLFLVGSVVTLISCIGLSFVSNTTSLFLTGFWFALRSLAITCIMMPIVTWGMSTMKGKYVADGTAILSTLRTIAGAVGTAVFVSIMSIAGSVSLIHGMNIAFICISVLAAIQCFIAVFFVGKHKKQSSDDIVTAA